MDKQISQADCWRRAPPQIGVQRGVSLACLCITVRRVPVLSILSYCAWTFRELASR